MSATADFYRVRIAECQAQADAAALDNVRDRSLRAMAAWQAMADRQTLTDTARADERRTKSAAIAVGEA